MPPNIPEEHEFTPRARTLTDADLAELSKLLHSQHPCRFDNISREDMDFIKDLLGMYKETRSVVMKWVIAGIIKGLLWVAFVSACIYGWFKFGGKH